MGPKHLFVDERLKGSCVYCGGPPETVDHVPSRVFLDDPLPENLPVVEACRECNGGFSLDEEYLACLLECVMTGTTDIEGLAREKVRRSLSRNPRLTAQLEACRWDDDTGRPWWKPDEARVRNVVIKLAKGHAAYELSETWRDEPDVCSVRAIVAMSEAERQEFEGVGGEAQCLWRLPRWRDRLPDLGGSSTARSQAVGLPISRAGRPLIEGQVHLYRIDRIGVPCRKAGRRGVKPKSLHPFSSWRTGCARCRCRAPAPSQRDCLRGRGACTHRGNRKSCRR